MKALGVNSFSGMWLVRLQIDHGPQGSLPFAVTCTPFSSVHHFRGKSYRMEGGLGGVSAGVKGEDRFPLGQKTKLTHMHGSKGAEPESEVGGLDSCPQGRS